MATIMNTPELAHLQSQLGYRFADPARLAEALRHRSYVNEHPQSGLHDNERLEFLGDAVLNMIVSHLLMTRHPDWREGQLSRRRAELVNETQLAQLAGEIGIGPCLALGRGEAMSNGQEKPSLLADALEAVVAAVYLDGGFQAAFNAVSVRFDTLPDSGPAADQHADHKSRLQEVAQTQFKSVPDYHVTGESGPDHDKTFQVQVSVGPVVAEGSGKSKKAAEQIAAGNALDQLET